MAAVQEAKIVFSAQDVAGAVVQRLQARLDALMAPMKRLQAMSARPLQLAGVGAVAHRLKGLRTAMEDVPYAGSMFAAGGMAAATGALLHNSVAAHDTLGKVADLSAAYKIASKDLQVFAEVGADSGTTVDDIAKSIGFLQQRIAGARSGDKQDLKVLAGVGVNAKDLKGDVASVYSRISDVFKASSTDADDALKIDFAKMVFGKAGVGMIPMLEEGGAKYAEVFSKMTAEGRLFAQAEVDAADGVGDAWGASMRRVEALRTRVGLVMAPMLQSITDAVDELMAGSGRTELIETFRKLGATIAEQAPRFIAAIPDVVRGLSSVFLSIQRFGSLVGWDKLLLGGVLFLASPFIASTISMGAAAITLGGSIAGVLARIAMLSGGVVMAGIKSVQGLALALRVAGLSAAGSWALALAPIAGVVLAVAAVAAAAYWVYNNWGGIKTFFAGMWEGIKVGLAPIMPMFEGLGAAAGWVGDRVAQLAGWFGGLFGGTKDASGAMQDWGAAGRTAGELVANAFKLAMTPLTALWDTVKVVWSVITKITGQKYEFESTTKAMWAGGTYGAGESPAEDRRFAASAPGGGSSGDAAAALSGGGGSPRLSMGGSSALPSVPIVSQRMDLAAKLDITVRAADGSSAAVDKVQSSNPNFKIDARAGGMFTTP